MLPARLVKFAVVGASGMVVNMLTLLVLADLLDVHTNLAAAIAIEISILSNFVLNDRWTFADRAAAAHGWMTRVFRFHAVSGVGASVQWLSFVLGNSMFAVLALNDAPETLLEAISNPPDVGAWKYVSQFAGIAIAAAWNFVANLAWTWKDAGAGRESE